jgi:hypothetical protein
MAESGRRSQRGDRHGLLRYPLAMTNRSQELLAAIRTLPPEDRLRLVEQVIHEVADAQASQTHPEPGTLIGLFGDCPEVMDQVCAAAMLARCRGGSAPQQT